MRKILFSIARYNDYRQDIFDNIISPRNSIFCEKHSYKYVEIKKETYLPVVRNNPIWWKIFTIKQLLEENKLQDGDIITALDADMYIHDLNITLVSDKSFTYSIDSGNTHCMGWYTLKINEWSRNLINLITDENRYNKLINKLSFHPKLNTYYSLWQMWAEQASWYSLAGIIGHSDIPFVDLKNSGYHSDITTDTIYSIEDLKNNICIYPTEYNVTEWENESSCVFNINPIKHKNDVKIRHFSGGQNWNNIKNWI